MKGGNQNTKNNGTYYDQTNVRLLAVLMMTIRITNRLSKIIETGLLLLSFLAVNEENELIILIKVWAYIKAMPKAAKKKQSKTYQFM